MKKEMESSAAQDPRILLSPNDVIQYLISSDNKAFFSPSFQQESKFNINKALCLKPRLDANLKLFLGCSDPSPWTQRAATTEKIRFKRHIIVLSLYLIYIWDRALQKGY